MDIDTDFKIATIYVTLLKHGIIFKKIEFNGQPLYLNVKDNDSFSEILIQPMTCRAMRNSNMPIDPDKVKYFERFTTIDCWFCGEDGKRYVYQRYSENIDYSIYDFDCLEPDVDLDDMFICLNQYYEEDIEEIKTVIIELRNPSYNNCENIVPSPMESSDDFSEEEEETQPAKKLKLTRGDQGSVCE